MTVFPDTTTSAAILPKVLKTAKSQMKTLIRRAKSAAAQSLSPLGNTCARRGQWLQSSGILATKPGLPGTFAGRRGGHDRSPASPLGVHADC